MKSLLTLIFLLLWGLLAQAQAQEGAFSQQKFDRPIREMAIILSDEGFYPQSLFAYKGERVRFYLTSVSNKPKCFMIPDKEVFLGVQRGQVTEAVVDFDREETVRFHCPSDKMEGEISVYEHPKDKAHRQRREIASESRKQVIRPQAWVPKDDMGKLRSNLE